MAASISTWFFSPIRRVRFDVLKFAGGNSRDSVRSVSKRKCSGYKALIKC
jgi:hypothetical protein